MIEPRFLGLKHPSPIYCNVEWIEEREGVNGDHHSCVLKLSHSGDHRCGSVCGSTWPQEESNE